ncbi:MAG: 16S rRNA (guanine1207-N2)-methyltransferase [Oceanicoccus sp.]|jgi:16S rRNA (guanine1207-N2)-methyltransferase
MSDPAFQLLRSQLQQLDTDKRALWVVDENITAVAIQSLLVIAVEGNITAVTNRYDVFNALERSNFTTLLNDFDFSPLAADSFDAVFYRISKEKPIVHHVINNAYDLLSTDGHLYLAGCKKEGVKTYVEKSKHLFGDCFDRQKGAAGAQLAKFKKTDAAGLSLDDKRYTESIDITYQDLYFCSKPGVYGWKKIDQGSEFLIANLPAVLADIPLASPPKVVDLGCGFGYLSVMASQLCEAEFVATDNNISAVEQCRKNFTTHSVKGEVILDDCAAGITDKFNLLLCNPPFHQGFDVDSALTEKFVKAAQRLLTVDGKAFFVVNSFIPLEKKAKAYFNSVEPVANNGRFKLLLMAH